MRRKEKFYTEEQKEIIKFGKILLGLILIIGLLYVFTAYVVNKEDSYKRTNNKGKLNYDTIAIGSLLNKADSEYYVLITDKTNMFSDLYLNRVSDYKSGVNHLPVYIADLSNELNKSFLSNESSYKADNIDEFKVKGTTLVKVKNKKIIKFIENKDDILNELN